MNRELEDHINAYIDHRIQEVAAELHRLLNIPTPDDTPCDSQAIPIYELYPPKGNA